MSQNNSNVPSPASSTSSTLGSASNALQNILDTLTSFEKRPRPLSASPVCHRTRSHVAACVTPSTPTLHTLRPSRLLDVAVTSPALIAPAPTPVGSPAGPALTASSATSPAVVNVSSPASQVPAFIILPPAPAPLVPVLHAPQVSPALPIVDIPLLTAPIPTDVPSPNVPSPVAHPVPVLQASPITATPLTTSPVPSDVLSPVVPSSMSSLGSASSTKPALDRSSCTDIPSIVTSPVSEASGIPSPASSPDTSLLIIETSPLSSPGSIADFQTPVQRHRPNHSPITAPVPPQIIHPPVPPAIAGAFRRPAQPTSRRVSSRRARPAPVSPVSTCPADSCLLGNTFHFVFPITDMINCPDSSCFARFRSRSWASMVHSVQRHLSHQHNIEVSHPVKWCGLCKQIIPLKPTTHNCFRTSGLPVIAYSGAVFSHTCFTCGFTFPSKRGLINHMSSHKVASIRANAAVPLPPRPPARPQRLPANFRRSGLPSSPVIIPPATSTVIPTSSAPAVPDPIAPAVPVPPVVPVPVPGPSTSSSAVLPVPVPVFSPPASEIDPVVSPLATYPVFHDSLPANLSSSSSPVAAPSSPAVFSQPTSSVFPRAASVPLVDPSPVHSQVSSGASEVPPPSSPSPSSSDSLISNSPDLHMELADTSAATAGVDLLTALNNPPANPTRQIEPDDDPPAPLEHFIQPLRDILDSPDDVDWILFEDLLAKIITTGQAFFNMPVATSPDDPPPVSRQPNYEDPKVIQRLYRNNRRRAVREITGQTSPRCPIPVAEVTAHFKNLLQPRTADISIYDHIPAASAPIDLSPFLPDEVSSKLKKTENSSPGADKLTYNHWKKLDPSCHTLALIFSICNRAHRIPSSWKASRTILIHKKGPEGDIANWRPIALTSTISKLYTGCWARRLREWALLHDVISNAQKGFMPFDGVNEHHFVLRQLLHDARNNSKELCLASLDISNAFGAIPHSALHRALVAFGVGDDFISLVDDLYHESSTEFAVSEGVSEPVPFQCGVRQGCPLSGLLFNISVEPVLRAVQLDSTSFRILAFADDLLLLHESPDGLQTALDVAVAQLQRLGLDVNTEKCYSLHLSGVGQRGARATTFTVNGDFLRALSDGDSAPFLGKPFGFLAPPPSADMAHFLRTANSILESRLAPWQRLDALKAFFFPALHFAMRGSQFPKEAWSGLDLHIRPHIKTTLSVPAEASSHYIYGHPHRGCIGIPEAAGDSDIAKIDSAFKLLTSLDPIVRSLAWDDLALIVRSRINDEPSVAVLMDFLSGSLDGPLARPSSQSTNLWAEARAASSRLGVTWHSTGDPSEPAIALKFKGSTITEKLRKKIFKTLRQQIRLDHSASLLTYPDQGKAMECVAADRASSHFTSSGRYTRFADWRFIHSARLNLVKLNGVKKGPASNRGCRRCAWKTETLPHVLDHCMRYSSLYQQRHNTIVRRVRRAATKEWKIVSDNQQVCPGLRERPDLVISKGTSAMIIDVTVPFENKNLAFARARQAKIQKYEPLAEVLRSSFKRVSIHAVIVGALGAWDPANDSSLKKICSSSYLRLMKKLCVSDTIRVSRDIYAEHLSGVRQVPWDARIMNPTQLHTDSQG